LTNNLTGIRGTNVWFGYDGKNVGVGNVFQNLTNGVLFDICYPLFSGSTNIGTINASDNYWSGGFNSMTFNLISGEGSSCSNSVRRNLERCSPLLTPPTGMCNAATTPCCGAEVQVSDGLNTKSSYTMQCFAGRDALTMQKNTNQTAIKADSDKLSIYPNPANETVKLDIERGDYHLRVLNTVGQTIFAQNTEGSLSVNIATWTNGIYLFEVTNKGTNKRQRSKIVVQH
jgi:Secretion system C-terminal sorting domain